MDTTSQLISGYTAYTDAEQLGAEVESDAPATITATATTVISTVLCSLTVGSAAATAYFGC
jgi:hypothetical protein